MENKKIIDDLESEEEQLDMIPSQTNVSDDKNCTNILDDVIQTTEPKAVCNIDKNDDPNDQNNDSKNDQNNDSKNDKNSESKNDQNNDSKNEKINEISCKIE